MLFDLQPKENIKDFFNYRKELDLFVKYLTDKSTRMIVIRGLRRVGKSSLLRVGLHKAKAKFVLVDARKLTSFTRRSFESELLEELKSISGLPDSLIKRIEAIDVGVRISFKSEESVWKILKKLNPIIAVDEVQMLSGSGVEAFLAAVYDNTKCKIVLTGSEVGVLENFLGKDNPKAPLFGRVYNEIKMDPLTREKSKEFLTCGFKEIGRSIDGAIIDKTLEELDGVVGWLTMFGNLSISLDFDTALNKTITDGAKLAYSELESFLASRLPAKKRYLTLLRILAEKDMKWGELKRALQIELMERISDPQFTNYLNSLNNFGFIIHSGDVYSIPDPLLRKALRML